MTRSVGEVAALAHVSVRTLHHYDEIGLLSPSERSDAGYRRYGDTDIERLQEVLFFRELGFPLSEIRAIVDAPSYTRRDALATHRRLLVARAERLRSMIELVDRAVDGMEEGTRMSDEEMLGVFGDFDPAAYEDEVRERWGDTDAYKESARRTKGYTKADWQRFRDESEEINLAIVALMDAGVPADDPRAMDAVDRARLQIDHWFYPCSKQMHANLGRMYLADPRFTATYERIREGMARYVHDAILANEARGD